MNGGSAPERMVAPAKRVWLVIEFLLLYGGLPLLVGMGIRGWRMFPVLWAVTGVCLAALLLDGSYPNRRLWRGRDLRKNVRRVLPVFAVGCVLITGLTLALVPERLFGFIRWRPGLWALVMVLYPILSVYPQGIVYRAFLFHRYRPLLPKTWHRILAGAVAFSMMHLVFGNWIAPLLTFPGGILFGRTYERTGSLLISNIEQAAYGCFIFTIGLGVFFYGGR